MLAGGQTIENYMERFNPDKHEVFLLIERKTDTTDRDNLNSNYYHKGDNLDMLMAMGEIVQRIADKMELSFDDTMEIMKNVHYQDKVVIRNRYKQRIEREWEND